MRYNKIVRGEFLSRPNRFIANIKINDEVCVCHVKNTGRCKELLIPGATVFLEESDNSLRKTRYDLISVYKRQTLINIDSQAPNKVFGEWAIKSGFFGEVSYMKPECKYKNSRFDFYIEAEGRKIFIEVKGVTLENDGVASFPDAPTQRGIKHLKELMDAVENGYEAYIFFIIQMKGCKSFVPNRTTHPEFADALSLAKSKGVRVKALECSVTENSLNADGFLEINIF